MLCISYLSGYGMIRARVVEFLTFGLMDYVTSVRLHTSVLHYLTALTALLHGISGFMIIIGKSRRISKKHTLEKLLWLLLAFLAAQLTILEFG